MALTNLIDYFLRVIGWNSQPSKYRELVNCLDSSFFCSKWKRTHLSTVAQFKLKLNVCLDKVAHCQLPGPSDNISRMEEFLLQKNDVRAVQLCTALHIAERS